MDRDGEQCGAARGAERTAAGDSRRNEGRRQRKLDD